MPWLLAIMTAAWFGWQADRSGRNRILWAVGGAAFGLVASTLVLGLGQAASIPFSEHETWVSRMKWTIVAVLLIAVAGWMLTSSLHRHHLVIWRKFSPSSKKVTMSAGDPKSGTTPASKPSATRV